MGGNYIVVTDLHRSAATQYAQAFGDPLPQLPLSAKLQRVFETGEPVISDFFRCSRYRQSAITLEVPVFSNGRSSTRWQWASLPIVLAIFCAGKIFARLDHGDLR